MNAVLAGTLPGGPDIAPAANLWSEEPRIGLKRDIRTRAAEEGMLHSTRHVRPKPGVALGAHIADLPEGWPRPFDRALPFGGEGRLAMCREWDPGAPLLGAAIGRRRRAGGGWDSLQRHPLPLHRVLPTESVLFARPTTPNAFDAAAANGGRVRVRSRREWGFGLAACGLWPED